MNTLRWVLKHMPKESSSALVQFISINPQWTGARWDDCLDALLETDSHLDVTEQLYEDEELKVMGPLPAAVAITCLYASNMFSTATPAQQLMMVKATIQNNGGYQE